MVCCCACFNQSYTFFLTFYFTEMIFIPFTIELILDFILINKGKKDLHWGWRIPMILLVSISSIVTPDVSISLESLILCLLPYCFFDIILNKLRGKPWDYLNNTKFWDRNLLRFNPFFILFIRCLAAVTICYVAYIL